MVGTIGQLPPGSITLIETVEDIASFEPRDPANLAYVTYADSEAAERGLPLLFRPCPRITGERDVRFDRAWMSPADQGP